MRIKILFYFFSGPFRIDMFVCYWIEENFYEVSVCHCSPPHEVRKGKYWIRHCLSVRPSVCPFTSNNSNSFVVIQWLSTIFTRRIWLFYHITCGHQCPPLYPKIMSIGPLAAAGEVVTDGHTDTWMDGKNHRPLLWIYSINVYREIRSTSPSMHNRHKWQKYSNHFRFSKQLGILESYFRLFV